MERLNPKSSEERKEEQEEEEFRNQGSQRRFTTLMLETGRHSCRQVRRQADCSHCQVRRCTVDCCTRSLEAIGTSNRMNTVTSLIALYSGVGIASPWNLFAFSSKAKFTLHAQRLPEVLVPGCWASHAVRLGC